MPSQKNIDDVKNSALKSLIDIKLKMTEIEKYQVKGDEEAIRRQRLIFHQVMLIHLNKNLFKMGLITKYL